MNEEKQTKKKIPDPLKAVIAVVLFFICAAFFIGIIVLPDELAKDQAFDTLILGSSLGKWGINASVLSENTDCKVVNLSMGPAPMESRKEVLEGALERYTTEVVIFEVCLDSCNAGDLSLWSANNSSWIVSRMVTPDTAAHYLIHDAKIPWYDYGIVWGAEADAGYNAWNHILHGNFDSYKQYAGSGYAEKTSDLTEYADELISDILQTSYNESRVEFNLGILRNMLELCNDSGVRSIIVSVPTSEIYCYYKSELDRFREELEGIAKEYDCEFYDFNLYKDIRNLLNDSSSFRDKTHLNGESSILFSELLAEEVLGKEREEVTVTDKFYDSYEDFRDHSIYSMIRIFH